MLLLRFTSLNRKSRFQFFAPYVFRSLFPHPANHASRRLSPHACSDVEFAATAETAMLQNFPIYVCVPEEEVAAVIDSCPDNKKEDLVFMSSGCLEPLLKSRGMCRGEQTQATLYFSVDKVRTSHCCGWLLGGVIQPPTHDRNE